MTFIEQFNQSVTNWVNYLNKSNTNPIEWLIEKPSSKYNVFIETALEQKRIGSIVEDDICKTHNQNFMFNHLGEIWCNKCEETKNPAAD